MFEKSVNLYDTAKKLMPGGVNSPVRSFKYVDCDPLFVDRGKGAFIFDVDGNKYIDYVCSWGSNLLGHSPSNVLLKIKNEINNGFSYGSNTQIEISFSKLIMSIYKSIEMVRVMSSGTEATMTAIRLARNYTKRNKILKFYESYHGHSDNLLAKDCSSCEFDGISSSTFSEILVSKFNDIDSVLKLFEMYGESISCVIVEPILTNFNLVLPINDFLLNLRKICDKYGSLLIFDEVVTGFRVNISGAQNKYGVYPDLTCLGKIAGGGFSIGVLGGRKEIMEFLSPIGMVYHGGTMAGNPITMRAGYETIKYCLDNLYLYDILEKNTFLIYENVKKFADKFDIKVELNYVCGMFGYKFINDKYDNFFKSFFKYLLKSGIYMPPSKFEVGFLSFSHSEYVIEKTLLKIEKALSHLKN